MNQDTYQFRSGFYEAVLFLATRSSTIHQLDWDAWLQQLALWRDGKCGGCMPQPVQISGRLSRLDRGYQPSPPPMPRGGSAIEPSPAHGSAVCGSTAHAGAGPAETTTSTAGRPWPPPTPVGDPYDFSEDAGVLNAPCVTRSGSRAASAIVWTIVASIIVVALLVLLGGLQ